jgi:hypothetical protein
MCVKAVKMHVVENSSRIRVVTNWSDCHTYFAEAITKCRTTPERTLTFTSPGSGKAVKQNSPPVVRVLIVGDVVFVTCFV